MRRTEIDIDDFEALHDLMSLAQGDNPAEAGLSDQRSDDRALFAGHADDRSAGPRSPRREVRTLRCSGRPVTITDDGRHRINTPVR